MRSAEPVAPPSPVLYRFGLFEADPASGTLTRSAVRVRIHEQPFRVLIALLEQQQEIVSRDELRRRLWPEGTFVDFDGSLNVIIKKLRAAIGDDPNNPRFIQTIPGRGYRFIAPVQTREARSIASAGAQLQPPGPLPPTVSDRRLPSLPPLAWAGGALMFLAMVIFLAVHFQKKAPANVIGRGADSAAVNSIAVVPFAN